MTNTTIAEPTQPAINAFDAVLLDLWRDKPRGETVTHDEIQAVTDTISTIEREGKRWNSLIKRMKVVVLDETGHEVISVRGVGYAKAMASGQAAERPKQKMSRMFTAIKRSAITAALVPNHELTDGDRRSRDITTACFERQMGAVTTARQQQKMLRLSRVEKSKNIGGNGSS